MLIDTCPDLRLRMAGGFFRMVPPSGESQLKPSSTDDIADDDFSLRLPELADLPRETAL
jgi:hypothetical protein